MKSVNIKMENHRLKLKNGKFILTFCIVILIFSFFIFHLPKASAAFLINRPLYIGLTTGLVGHWSFDGPDMDSTFAYDRSGQGHTGRLQNGPVRTIGKIGQALEFDGSNDNVGGGSFSTSISPIGSRSICSWFKTNGTARMGIAGTRPMSGSAGFSFLVNRTTAGNLTYFHTGGTTLEVAAGILPGIWYHGCVTLDTAAAVGTLYVNGASIGSQSSFSVEASGGDNGVLGNENVNYDGPFNGILDDVRVYNRAISQDEIKRLYKMGATTKINVSRKDTLTNGLVGHWSFDGPDMAGTIAYDRSGQGNNGTLTNGPVRTEGKIGQALSFDGTNDYVSIPDSNSLDVGNTVTIAAWIYTRDLSTRHTVYDASPNDTAGAVMLEVGTLAGSYTNGVAALISGTFVSMTTGNVLSNNVWTHVVYTRSGTGAGTHKIYINGVSVALATSGGSWNDAPNFVDNAVSKLIGVRSTPSSIQLFPGFIDDVRIYNRAISPDEIKRLYKMGATTKINVPRKDTLTNGLLGYWTFDGPDVAGVIAYDRSGLGNNGTLTSGPVRTIGKIGQALSFDGSNDYVNVPVGASLAGRSAASVSLWYFAQAAPSANAALFYEDTWTAGFSRFAIFHNSNGDLLSVMRDTDAGSSFLATETGGMAANMRQWIHVVLTFDAASDNLILYRNGAQVAINTAAKGPFTVNCCNDPTAIGAYSGSGNPSYINGLIDEVRLYNRALTAAEVKRLYLLGK